MVFGPGPPECEFKNSFMPVFVVRGYSTTSQSFMILPTRKVGELVMSQFFYLRKKHLGPRPPLSDNLNIDFTCYHRESVLNNYPKFHASTYTGNRRICYFQFLYSPY